MKTAKRFMRESGTEVFIGNELLVKGVLETEGGVHVLGGYPGSPVAGYFDALGLIREELQAHGVRAVINSNEALAAAMCNGTQALPARALICMKSVGAHVAADALAMGNLAGANPEGGVVAVFGDDPWSDSTQTAVDSRFISKHLFMPVVEPSNPQEVKDFVNLAFKLSAASELFVGFVLTTNLADGGGTVQCRENHWPDLNMQSRIELATRHLGERVMLPPITWRAEERFPDRHARAVKAARELGLNKIEYAPAGGKAPVGFVAAGLGHDYLIQALGDLNLLGDLPVLKLGMSYPMDGELLEEFAGLCERVVVVEERRGFMEEQIAEVAQRSRQNGGAFTSVEVWGKHFPDGLPGIPTVRGLHPSLLTEQLAPILKKWIPDFESRYAPIHEIMEKTGQVVTPFLPARLPTFCPGCPHRDSSNLCLELKRDLADPIYMGQKGLEPIDVIFHGDTGCYTMLIFPPNAELMHDCSGMGLGGGTGSGTDILTTNREVVFMGDSTFFHSGKIAISQAINIGQNITFIILDNSTTAMTGHQPTPGVNFDILGNETPPQDIEQVVRGIAGSSEAFVTRVDPEKRDDYRHLLEQSILSDGVKVIISTKECSITRQRRQRRLDREELRELGFLRRQQVMNINSDLCVFCQACTEQTGCPGLQHTMTDHGLKMDTSISACVNDGACMRMGVCDSFERITIKRQAPPRDRIPELELDKIPEPQKASMTDRWRLCLTGVGGMGIGLAGSILVRAGHYEGLHVIFYDKKGLAIRNGSVVTQLVFTKQREPVTGVIGYGQADVLIGVDLLESARLLEPAQRMRIIGPDTTAVLNTAKAQTISGIMGRDDFDPDELVALIKSQTAEEKFLARDISRFCEKYLGSQIYANIMMLGYAFQQGLIPVSMHSMAWAIKDSIRVDFKKNLYAFNMGRKLVVSPELFQGRPARTGWAETLDSKLRWGQRRYGKDHPCIEGLAKIAQDAVEKLDGLDEASLRDFAIRLYDALRFGGLEYARRYADGVLSVFGKDRPEYDYAAAKAVIVELASAMCYRDLIYEAELATSPEKFARDREKYNINPPNGDKLSYRYFWNRQFRIFGKTFKKRFTLRRYQLRLLKRMRWLRPLLAPFNRNHRDWLRTYETYVAQFAYHSADEYQRELIKLTRRQCMDCHVPTCRLIGCPAANAIPVWMREASLGNFKAASKALHETNNFPEFTGEICPAFCEQSCKRNASGRPAQVRLTERQIVEEGFAHGYIKPQKAKAKLHKRVAIVGSGPAGLAAAQQLARAGAEVTVFEKDDAPGGLLRYGIPEDRLAKSLIDRRLEQLRAEGVTFRCDCEVGNDISGEQLRTDFDAVLLAGGAQQPRDLDVPGRAGEDVIFALDLLKNGHASELNGKRVAVIGGGLTGEDCVDEALKAGAAEVTQLEILPSSQAASLPLETAEKVHRHFAVKTTRFLREAGKLAGLELVSLDYTPSPHGAVVTEKNDPHTVEADVAILAAGFAPALDEALAGQLGVELNGSTRPPVNEFYRTNADGVFACGDLATGPSYVITAIDSGRKAAKRILEYLRG